MDAHRRDSAAPRLRDPRAEPSVLGQTFSSKVAVTAGSRRNVATVSYSTAVCDDVQLALLIVGVQSKTPPERQAAGKRLLVALCLDKLCR